MSDKVLTVKLPDGSTESRKTPRDYTHAIIVTQTKAERDARIAKFQAKLEAASAKLAELTAKLTVEDRAAYDAAIEQEKHVQETMAGASITEYMAAFRAASHARWSSITGQIEALTLGDLASANHQLEAATKFVVGASFVYGWSQAPHNAMKMAQKAQEEQPGNAVSISTDIEVRVVQKREKKTA